MSQSTTQGKNEILLTPDELSERWKGKPKPSTLANWRSAGIGPEPTRIGRFVKYRISAIEDFERMGHPTLPRGVA